MSRVAEDESEPEDENKSGEDAVQPRDSGCFESSDNMEGRRDEPKTEEGLEDEALEEPEKQQEEEEVQQHREEGEEELEQAVDVVQEQLQELTVEEGS